MTDFLKTFTQAHGQSAEFPGAAQLLMTAQGNELQIQAGLEKLQQAALTVPSREMFDALGDLLEEVPYPASDAVAKFAKDYAEQGSYGDIQLKTLQFADMVERVPGLTDPSIPDETRLPTAKQLRAEFVDRIAIISVTPAIAALTEVATKATGLSDKGEDVLLAAVEAKVSHFLKQADGPQGRRAPELADKLLDLVHALDTRIPPKGDLPGSLFKHVGYERRLEILTNHLEAMDISPEREVTEFLSQFGTTSDDFYGEDGLLRPATDFVKPHADEVLPVLELGPRPRQG